MPVVQLNSANAHKALVFWGGGTYTASGSAAGYPAINAGLQDTYSKWRSNAAGAYILTVNKGSVQQIDSVGIAAHNMATSGVSVFRIETSTNGTTYNAVGTVNVTTNEDLIVLFPAVSAQYVRIVFFNSPPPCNIGVFVAAKRLDFESCAVLDYTPIHHSLNYTKEFNESINGNFLTNRLIASGAQTEANLGFQSRAFVEGPMRAFEDWYNRGNCFFYAGTPDDMPIDMGYCKSLPDSTINVNYIEAGKYANITFDLDVYRGL